jgi:hypothetical protein
MGKTALIFIGIIQVIASSFVYFIILKIIRKKKDFTDLIKKNRQFKETIITSRLS